MFNEAYVHGFIEKCASLGVDPETLIKQGGLADLFRGVDPAWYGSETSNYIPYSEEDEPKDADVEVPKGVYHGIKIRENDEQNLFNRVIGSSKGSIPRSRVAEIVKALKAARVDVKPVSVDDTHLEFGYPVGAGYAGSRLSPSGRREASYLPYELRNTIDDILYGAK
jgi:hypothetical protein